MNTFTIDGQELSLTDIAGMNTSDVEAKFRVKLPKGLYQFEVSKAALESQPNAKNSDKTNLLITAELTVIGFINIPDTSVDKEALIGEKKFENFYLSQESAEKFKDSLGYWKGFAQLTGYANEGELDAILQGWIGTRFAGQIKHRVNPNDSDDPYVNLDRDKVQAIPAEQPAAA